MMKRWFLVPLLTAGVMSFGAGTVRADSLQTVAKKLMKGLDQLPSKRIAVLPFPYPNGDVSSGSSIISERLTTLLVERGGPEVVERTLLDKAMDEIKLGMTGALDPATTQKLGKILGVSAIVTGTLNDVDESETEVNARLIQTETGKIMTAAMARVRRTWTDMPRKPPFAESMHPSEEPSVNHSSKLIPVASVRRRPATVYAGPMQPLDAETADEAGQEVLTLTNEDLIPLKYRGRTDPGSIVDQFLTESTAPPNGVRMARRIYHSNPDPRLRGRALLAMGHLLERTGRPEQAATAYNQLLKEFPDAPILQAEARQRLEHVSQVR
jgi:hypothetical protein